MNALARPIHLPGRTVLETVRERAQVAIDAWAREWIAGYAESPHRVQISTLHEAHEGTGRSHERTGPSHDALMSGREYAAVRSEAGCIWFGSSVDDRVKFSRAVVGAELTLGSTCVDDWVLAVVERAHESRNRALHSALLGKSAASLPHAHASALPPELFAFGAGSVLFTCEPLGLHAIADGTVLRSVPPMERAGKQSRASLIPMEKAVHGSCVSLEVSLGRVEIELPKLLDLRPGDVLRFPQRLDEGLAVMCAGKPLARAALGERHGCRSVQILAPHS